MNKSKEQIVDTIRNYERILDELYAEARESGLIVMHDTYTTLSGSIKASISEPDIRGKQYD